MDLGFNDFNLYLFKICFLLTKAVLEIRIPHEKWIIVPISLNVHLTSLKMKQKFWILLIRMNKAIRRYGLDKDLNQIAKYMERISCGIQPAISFVGIKSI